MPYAAPRPCSYPGCARLGCTIHAVGYRPVSPERMNKQRLYNDRRWRTARARFIEQHPLCLLCHADGRLVPTYAVDHITPHGGNTTLFWDTNNWQPLCQHHHNAKARSEMIPSRGEGLS